MGRNGQEANVWNFLFLSMLDSQRKVAYNAMKVVVLSQQGPPDTSSAHQESNRQLAEAGRWTVSTFPPYLKRGLPFPDTTIDTKRLITPIDPAMRPSQALPDRAGHVDRQVRPNIPQIGKS